MCLWNLKLSDRFVLEFNIQIGFSSGAGFCSNKSWTLNATIITINVCWWLNVVLSRWHYGIWNSGFVLLQNELFESATSLCHEFVQLIVHTCPTLCYSYVQLQSDVHFNEFLGLVLFCFVLHSLHHALVQLSEEPCSHLWLGTHRWIQIEGLRMVRVLSASIGHWSERLSSTGLNRRRHHRNKTGSNTPWLWNAETSVCRNATISQSMNTCAHSSGRTPSAVERFCLHKSAW